MTTASRRPPRRVLAEVRPAPLAPGPRSSDTAFGVRGALARGFSREDRGFSPGCWRTTAALMATGMDGAAERERDGGFQKPVRSVMVPGFIGDPKTVSVGKYNFLPFLTVIF